MAIFTINPANSVVTNANGVHAFNGDSAAADTLTVNANAHLIALGGGSNAASLANTLGWKVTINGWLYSQFSQGILLAFGNTALSTITIGADAEIGASNSGIFAGSAVTIKNSGQVSAAVGIDLASTGTVTNSGTIEGIFTGIRISGSITTTITNTGVVSGANGSIIDDSSGSNDKVTNSGQLIGDVTLGGGTNMLTNKGVIQGDVNSAGGNDTMTNTGTITGIINLGAGDDGFKGGKWAETLRDAPGSDTYRFGAGNDTYLAKRVAGTDGTDLVDGGAGIDTYDANDATGNLLINIDRVNHDFSSLGLPGVQLQTSNTAIGSDIDGGFGTHDTVTNFENVKGGSASDTIYGSALANVIEGNGGGDTLFGFGGNDTLLGGAGTDILIGGAGRDTLEGGIDGAIDRFVFTALSDSRPGKGARDKIANFEDGFDLIDLSRIDARSGTAADDAFAYLNGNSVTTPAAAFSGNGLGGELRSVWTATGYVLEGDVNGDGKADFAIDIVDPNHSITLTAADFIL